VLKGSGKGQISSAPFALVKSAWCSLTKTLTQESTPGFELVSLDLITIDAKTEYPALGCLLAEYPALQWLLPHGPCDQL